MSEAELDSYHPGYKLYLHRTSTGASVFLSADGGQTKCGFPFRMGLEVARRWSVSEFLQKGFAEEKLDAAGYVDITERVYSGEFDATLGSTRS